MKGVLIHLLIDKHPEDVTVTVNSPTEFMVTALNTLVIYVLESLSISYRGYIH